MHKLRSRGFTLIELLVVIAIIGILSAVVLASLNTARSKGSDAAIQSDLDGARTEAELYYSNNGNSYSSMCGGSDTTFNNQLKNAYTSAGKTAITGCNVAASGQAYAVWQTLVSASSQVWCVDNTGTSRAETAPSAGASQC